MTAELDDTLEKEVLIASPCISICALDADDVCVGCYRSGQEITRWSVADNTERRAILASAAERARAVNPF
ncbi:MAG: DUF1289 domain-containing protein [Cellvibrionales bacterium]|jgi:predicted Fe-S protein YdhL (DUF1289 family)|nr:DUF1289 domain-containing protein [Cellvibrionales bacterium]MBK8675030.1 DUF1289 domain-containing protein [Cellvibrionales bacterium]